MRQLAVFLICLRGSVAQITVLQPKELAKTAFNDKKPDEQGYIHGGTAAFTTPHFEQKIIGVVMYEPSPSFHCGSNYGPSKKSTPTSEPTRYTTTTGPTTTTKDSDPIRTVWHSVFTRDFPLAKIMLVDRGGCEVKQKVKVAQRMGANAVLVRDRGGDLDESTIHKVHIGTPDNDLSIPTILITKASGDKLAAAAEIGIKKAAEKMTSPEGDDEDGGGLLELVMVRLHWDVPDSDVVKFDLWMQSAKPETLKFLHDFAPMATKLSTSMEFQPHFHIERAQDLMGDLEQCIGPYKECGDEGAKEAGTLQNDCQRWLPPQTYHHNGNLGDDLNDTFCSKDPDGAGPIVGAVVVQQDLMQLCVYQVQKAKGDTNKYWDFVKRLQKECPLEEGFTMACTHQLLETLDSQLGGFMVDDVVQCETQDAQENLDHERIFREWGPPAVKINDWRYSGPLDADELMRALCLGFAKDKQPAACVEFTRKSPTPVAPGTNFTYEEVIDFLKKVRFSQKSEAEKIDILTQQIEELTQQLQEVRTAPVVGPSTSSRAFLPGATAPPGLFTDTSTTQASNLLAPAGSDSDLMKYLPFGVLFLAVLCVSVAFGMILQARLMQTALVQDMRLQPAQRTPLLEQGDSRSDGNPANAS
mmetsp:Transcript_28147/g.65037  ORF Transcript_28147/g.65037 Transcript_28147/m.65037 type:complete len:640 (+) Transcript_28147:39-1958(+)